MFALAAVLSASTPALAQLPGKGPHGEKAAEKAAEKAENKADKAEEQAREARRAARRVERAAKAKEEKVALRAKVTAALKGRAMTPALREALRIHARRLARLDRVRVLADEAKDAEVVARVDKLIAKETARHDKWLERYDAKADGK